MTAAARLVHPYAGPAFIALPSEHSRTGWIEAAYLELPGRRLVRGEDAQESDWERAADLAQRRLRNCWRGSYVWMWRRALIAEHERRRRASLTVLPGGAR